VHVSAALVQEKVEERVKKKIPVPFVSKVLGPSKRNYTKMDRIL
jgi:hypothetical protein